jgi:riboflavin synthase
MFTGIIEAIGKVGSIQPRGSDFSLQIESDQLDMHDVKLGDSIAVNGVCLTATKLEKHGFWADVSNETLSKTTFRHLTPGSAVNLEKALTLSSRLGGHLVSGHVDGIGKLINQQPDGQSIRLDFSYPQELDRYIAAKGSITVQGISLTVNHVENLCFSLNIVPHTLAKTTLANRQEGMEVNLEVDVIARYLEKLIRSDSSPTSPPGGKITEAFLAQHGFMR